jgi:transcriptional regulator with XRE-family HTH domain
VTSGSPHPRPERRAELAAFLRASRARLTPRDAGLPDGSASGRRRTAGLRREEVAELSGVGVTWYTWLEQGRDIATSAQVIDALARALLLTGDQHRHLRELADLPPPPEPPAAGSDMLPRLQRLVDAVAPSPASVYDEHFDYLAWNRSYVRVRHDPGALPVGRRNLPWIMFTDPGNRARILPWEAAARAVLGQFRAAAGRHHGDPRFAELTAALSEASPQFRDWWAEYPVRYFRPATIAVNHPQAGLMHLELFQLQVVDQPRLIMVTQVPADETSLERVISLLRDTGQRLSRVSRLQRHQMGGTADSAAPVVGRLPYGEALDGGARR